MQLSPYRSWTRLLAMVCFAVLSLLGAVMVWLLPDLFGQILGAVIVVACVWMTWWSMFSGCAIDDGRVVIRNMLGRRRIIEIEEIASVRLVRDPLRRFWFAVIDLADKRVVAINEFTSYGRPSTIASTPVGRFVEDLREAANAS